MLHLSELCEWEACGRLGAVCVATGKLSFVVVGVYGFAVSHARCGHNQGTVVSIALCAS